MSPTHRVHAAWSPRNDGIDRIAHQCLLLLTALESVHPELRGFSAEGHGRARFPVAGIDGCKRALDESSVRWTMGGEERIAHRPRFFLPRGGALTAELTLVCGATPLPLAGVFAPNRLDLVLGGDLGDATAAAATIDNALRAAVAVFRPLHGHAGTPTSPAPSASLFSDGRPAVGWMTYLSSAYPPLPSALPKPATAEAVAHLGTLLVAHAGLASDDGDSRAAVDRLRAALDAAGVLVPASALAAGTSR